MRILFFMLFVLIFVLPSSAFAQYYLHQEQQESGSTIRTMEWEDSSIFDLALEPYGFSLSLSNRWSVRCRDTDKIAEFQAIGLCYAEDDVEGKAHIAMYIESPLLQLIPNQLPPPLLWQDETANFFLTHLGELAIKHLPSIDNQERLHISYKIDRFVDNEIKYEDTVVAQMRHYEVTLFDKRNGEEAPPLHTMHVAISFFSHLVLYPTGREIIYKELNFIFVVYNRGISADIRDDALQLMSVFAPQIRILQ